LHLVAGCGGTVVVVHALGAVDAGDDRSGPGAGSGLSVAGGHDVGLDGVLGGVGREAGGHHAFVEGAGGAVAVVAADAEDNGTFQVQGRVPARRGQRSTVVGLQAARV